MLGKGETASDARLFQPFNGGLGGHLLEMAEASNVAVEIHAEALPLLPKVLELAEAGLLPAGSHANKRFRIPDTSIANGVDPLRVDIAFDAQTSGGLVLALMPDQIDQALAMLREEGDQGWIIGSVQAYENGQRLRIA